MLKLYKTAEVGYNNRNMSMWPTNWFYVGKNERDPRKWTPERSRPNKVRKAAHTIGERALDWLVLNSVTGKIGEVAATGYERAVAPIAKAKDKLLYRTYGDACGRMLDALEEYELAQMEDTPLGPGSKDFAVSVDIMPEGETSMTVVTLQRLPENIGGSFRDIKKLEILLHPDDTISFNANGEPRTFAKPNMAQHFNNVTNALTQAMQRESDEALLSL
jgi:hypothetical protein